MTVSAANTGLRPLGEIVFEVADASFREEQRIPPGSGPPVVLAALFDTEGAFDVTISSPGFQDWHRDDVSVARIGRCGTTQTVDVAVVLQPGQQAAPTRPFRF